MTTTTTIALAAQSRFAFARATNEPAMPQHCNENVAAAANTATPLMINTADARRTGVVSRLVGAKPSPKYGFIQTSKGENIFFHWKGLSIEAMACIECGTEVEFDVCPNPFSENKPMAQHLSVKGSTNRYRNATGTISRWFPEKHFGFLETADGATHFAHVSAFMTENSMITDVSQLVEGMQVVFTKSINYKSSPPKPFALDITVTAAAPMRPTLRISPTGRPALKAWTPSARTLSTRNSGGGELCDTSTPSSPSRRASWRSNNTGSASPRNLESGSSSWRSSAGSGTAKSSLFQSYKTPNACKPFAKSAPPPGFNASNGRSSWRRAAAPAC